MFHFLFALIATVTITTEWVDYKDEQLNFKVSYPDNWTIVKKQGITMFLMSKEKVAGEFSEHLTIMKQDLSAKPMSLDEFTQLTLEKYTQPPAADNIEPVQELKLDSHNATSVILTISYKGMDLKVKQYWFVKDNSAYIFTYTAYQSTFAIYEAAATKLIESFEFTN